jgi:hypothetical protein
VEVLRSLLACPRGALRSQRRPVGPSENEPHALRSSANGDPRPSISRSGSKPLLLLDWMQALENAGSRRCLMVGGRFSPISGPTRAALSRWALRASFDHRGG